MCLRESKGGRPSAWALAPKWAAQKLLVHAFGLAQQWLIIAILRVNQLMEDLCNSTLQIKLFLKKKKSHF